VLYHHAIAPELPINLVTPFSPGSKWWLYGIETLILQSVIQCSTTLLLPLTVQSCEIFFPQFSPGLKWSLAGIEPLIS
jgi:hypothetical protein